MIQPNVNKTENLVNLSSRERSAIQDNIDNTVPKILQIINP